MAARTLLDLIAGISAGSIRIVCFEMQTLAETHNTLISAPLFGALAGRRNASRSSRAVPRSSRDPSQTRCGSRRRGKNMAAD